MAEQTGWLLERTQNGHPIWFSLVDGEPGWTVESAEALRFSRQSDAALFSAHYLGEGACAAETEHMWLDTSEQSNGPKQALTEKESTP